MDELFVSSVNAVVFAGLAVFTLHALSSKPMHVDKVQKRKQIRYALVAVFGMTSVLHAANAIAVMFAGG